MSRRAICFTVLGMLAGCVPYPGADQGLSPKLGQASPSGSIETGGGRAGTDYTVLTPVPVTPSNPAVATRGDVLAYARSLAACKRDTAAALGPDDGDSVAAVRRALKERPAGSTLTIGFQADDPVMIRDAAVKKCLRSKGYIVNL